MVLNTDRKPAPEYLILHRATYFTITESPAKGEYGIKDFIKHCAEQRAELRGFARVECGGEAQACGVCRP